MRAARLPKPAGDLAVAGIALGAAWGLKAFYSGADFEALHWILTPTVALVEWSTGVRFELEPHAGWLSRDHAFLVAPACAGVNFLIVAFVSLCLGLAPACTGLAARAALVAGSAVAAWATTVIANATRIAIAMRMHDAGAAWGPWTRARLHCAEGVLVYVVFLFALVALGERVSRGRYAIAR